jgi:hypothetical protein
MRINMRPHSPHVAVAVAAVATAAVAVGAFVAAIMLLPLLWGRRGICVADGGEERVLR